MSKLTYIEVRIKGITLNSFVSQGELCVTVNREELVDLSKEIWNAALEWAAENARVKSEWQFVLSLGDDDHPGETTYFVDKESILKGKI